MAFTAVTTRGCSATVRRERGSQPPGDLPPQEAQEGCVRAGLGEETGIQSERKGHLGACVMSGVPGPAGPLSRLCRLFIRLQ